MAKAALSSHAPALYSLAVIQFNGSGGSKNDKDHRGGVALCARAPFLGHIDALRELGHCLQNGYSVRQNVVEGRRTHPIPHLNHRHPTVPGCPLLSDFGCNVPAPEAHPASKFLVEWLGARGGVPGPGLRLCSHPRRALDWKLRHKTECAPVDQWRGEEGDGGEGNEAVNGKMKSSQKVKKQLRVAVIYYLVLTFQGHEKKKQEKTRPVLVVNSRLNIKNSPMTMVAETAQF
ncbi:F-box protein [Hibiscus syriacus]|uniref:F-box protein n=1 Tax=Hibiscus syriacus TaxID=106335 RepID=A0A6A2Z8A9_HIBSY|nr:F-box protein [Hibiscus syriacus]